MPKPKEEEIEELPEGQDSFDRAYVTKLREQAAGYRTKLKRFSESFEGLNDQETDWMLEKVQAIASDPDAGSAGLLDVVKGFMSEESILEALDFELGDTDPEDGEEEESEVDQVEALKALLEERDQAAAKVTEEAEIEAAREEIYAEIEAAGFERGTDGFQAALALGKIEANAGRDFSFVDLAPRIAAAAGIENFQAPVTEEAPTEDAPAAEGPKHPSTVGAGGNGAAGETEKDWIAETKKEGGNLWEAARERLETRLDNGSN